MDTTSDPLIGHRLAGKYEITNVLGHGGFGTVYAAIQHPVARRVAVKLIRPEHVRNEDVRQRFLREAHAVAALSHSSIVTLFDYGVEPDGRVYMVLEYIDGDELYRVMRRDGPMEPARVVALGRQALAGLAEAHRLNLVHRDLKPANMMVVTDSIGQEQLKILDFGIAKLLGGEGGFKTKDGIALGTPTYMSPEQALARGIGPWSDQYALGVVLYEMVAGRPPFAADSELELLNHHIQASFPAFRGDLAVPAALEAVIARALAKAPEERFPGVIAMADALASSLNSSSDVVWSVGGRGGSTKHLAARDEAVLADQDGVDLPPTAALPAHGAHRSGDEPDGTPLMVGAVPSSAHTLAEALPKPSRRWPWAAAVLAAAAVTVAALVASPGDEEGEPTATPTEGASLTAVPHIDTPRNPPFVDAQPADAAPPHAPLPVDAAVVDQAVPDAGVDGASPAPSPTPTVRVPRPPPAPDGPVKPPPAQEEAPTPSAKPKPAPALEPLF